MAEGSQGTSRGIVSGERQRDPAVVEERARRIAGGLDRLGVGPGDCVAILMRNDIAFLEATYGAAMLGAYAVPVNWHLKADEVRYILDDCEAKVLVGHEDLLAPLDGHLPGSLAVFRVPVPPEVAQHFPPPAAAELPAGARDLDLWLAGAAPYEGAARPAPMSMIYTSGTTGKPKGVKRKAPTPEEAKATEGLRALVYGLRPGVRALLPGPLYHSAPNSFGIRAGRLGGVLVLMPRFDAEEMLRLIEEHRIDTIFMVPTMFVRLLKLPEAVRSRYDLSSLRFVIHAAAPCPADVKAAMIAWWGPVIHEFYGGTETGPVTFATSEDALRKPGSVGRLSPGAEIRVLGEDGREVPPGETGELFCRIAGYPDFTYHKAPEKRAEVDDAGFITCGDIGYVDPDGYVFLCDRKRDMIIAGGVNIYPAEIEAALLALPQVRDCAVFGIPHAEFGESIMAVIAPQPGVEIDPAALKAELSTRIADYKLPRHIEIRDDLPREDSGKIFKRRLRDPYWAAAGRAI
ncbi:acyl-CoA synthetase [Phreatobacter cathodiphilus]|uniref:Long-chain fatty acid--CoA ligase n=1 Tax=Phreatobacter cathodiphilus TaxID=1868589 RepID=A0A2S0NFZ5_9HYPH|nr:acyl-CoA synthetase [Phreatobacter cathodiphilus]AVO46861.1 long-chain fatty acid--CoA ligase [Phreatobacter cathodiphilus]